METLILLCRISIRFIAMVVIGSGQSKPRCSFGSKSDPFNLSPDLKNFVIEVRISSKVCYIFSLPLPFLFFLIIESKARGGAEKGLAVLKTGLAVL